MTRITYQRAALAMLLLYPGSIALAASGSGMLDSLSQGLEGQPRAARRAASLPVAEALVQGDRNEYHRELGALRERLQDPQDVRTLGPLAEQLEESWQARLDSRRQAHRRELGAGVLEDVGRSLGFGAIVGGVLGLVLAAAGAPVLGSLAVGIGTIAALDFIWTQISRPPGSGAPRADRRRPAEVLPMARVRADASLEAAEEARTSGAGTSATGSGPPADRGAPGCDPDSSVPSFDCLEGGD